LTDFTTTTEAFVAANHWSSTEINAINAWTLDLTGGNQGSFGGKTNTLNRVRAFRKLAL
jgi:hypothetical protein